MTERKDEPTGGTEPQHGTAARIGLITAILTLISALIGVVVLIINAATGNGGNHASTQPPMSSAASPSTPAVATSVPQPSTASTAPTTPTAPVTPASSLAPAVTPSAPAAPVIRHKGTLIVEFGTKPADIDAPASDPQWGRGDGVAVSEEEFARYSGNGYQYINAPEGVELRNTPFTYDECKYSQVLQPTNLLKLNAESNICFHTDDGRVSLIQVAHITDDVLTLSVVTYESD